MMGLHVIVTLMVPLLCVFELNDDDTWYREYQSSSTFPVVDE